MKKLLLSGLLILALLISAVGCGEWISDTPEPTVTPTPTEVTPEPTPTPEPVYADSSGLFSVPIPTNWTAEQAEGYGILTSPDGNMTVYVMAIEAESVEEGTRTAWAVIDPTFDLEPDEVIQEPVTNGVDEAVTIIYDTGDDNEIIIAGGWLYEGIAYIEIFLGDLVTFQKRVSQLTIISSGYDIYALKETDLSNVEPLPLTDELLAELEAYIIEAMERYEVPGAAVAVVKDGEIVYTKGFGVREMGGDDPVTPETLMLIGSTTKTMTTMLMAQLVDEGLMDWDTPVVDIMPTFAVADPEITHKITVQHLVCACTGVPRRDFEMIFNSEEMSAEDIVESLADFEFFTDFGEAFQYSNQMVATGGYVAALAAGGEYGNLYDDYLALMQEHIFDPIGMTHTTFSFDEARASGNYGTPHKSNIALEYSPVPLETEEVILTPISPAGGAWSNVLDMASYLITELNEGVTPDGTRVVSAENLGVTWEPQVAITHEMSYGLGWIVDEYKGLPVLHHGGNTLGFTSDLAFLPDTGLGISVLTNQYGSLLNQLVRFRLLELLYQQEPEAEEMAQFQLYMMKEASDELMAKIQESIDPEEVEPYLGQYSNAALGDITVQWQGDKLIFDTGEFQAEIRSKVDDEGDVSYILYDSVLAGLGVELNENEKGNPVIVIGAGVNEYTFENVQ